MMQFEKSDYFLRYECDPDGMWHQWAAIRKDRSFAVHIWCRKRAVEPGIYGGVEQHVKPADGEEPSHERCPFLNGPCRHDGSSLFFEESFRRRAEEAIETGDYQSMLRAAYGVLVQRDVKPDDGFEGVRNGH